MLPTFIVAILLSLPLGGAFVVLVPGTSPWYKLLQFIAVGLVFVSYLWGPKYADHLFRRESEGL